MPHQCVNCEKTFPDGTKEILNGCGDCGGNKFQFVAEEGETGSQEPELESTDDEVPVEVDSPESDAQRSARTDVVDTNNIPSSAFQSNESVVAGTDVDESGEDESHDSSGPSLENIREELNEQFESIRIVSPGEYELNLMELYRRDDRVVSLYDDGKYAIHITDEPEPQADMQ